MKVSTHLAVLTALALGNFTPIFFPQAQAQQVTPHPTRVLARHDVLPIASLKPVEQCECYTHTVFETSRCPEPTGPLKINCDEPNCDMVRPFAVTVPGTSTQCPETPTVTKRVPCATGCRCPLTMTYTVKDENLCLRKTRSSTYSSWMPMTTVAYGTTSSTTNSTQTGPGGQIGDGCSPWYRSDSYRNPPCATGLSCVPNRPFHVELATASVSGPGGECRPYPLIEGDKCGKFDGGYHCASGLTCVRSNGTSWLGVCRSVPGVDGDPCNRWMPAAWPFIDPECGPGLRCTYEDSDCLMRGSDLGGFCRWENSTSTATCTYPTWYVPYAPYAGTPTSNLTPVPTATKEVGILGDRCWIPGLNYTSVPPCGPGLICSSINETWPTIMGFCQRDNSTSNSTLTPNDDGNTELCSDGS